MGFTLRQSHDIITSSAAGLLGPQQPMLQPNPKAFLHWGSWNQWLKGHDPTGLFNLPGRQLFLPWWTPSWLVDLKQRDLSKHTTQRAITPDALFFISKRRTCFQTPDHFTLSTICTIHNGPCQAGLESLWLLLDTNITVNPCRRETLRQMDDPPATSTVPSGWTLRF